MEIYVTHTRMYACSQQYNSAVALCMRKREVVDFITAAVFVHEHNRHPSPPPSGTERRPRRSLHFPGSLSSALRQLVSTSLPEVPLLVELARLPHTW